MTTSVKFKGFLSWLWKQLVAIVLFVCNFLKTIARYLGFEVVEHGGIIDDDPKVGDEEVTQVSDSNMDDTDNVISDKKSPSATKKRIKRKIIDNKHTPAKISEVPRTPYDKNMEDSVENTDDVCHVKNPYCVVIGNTNFDDMFVPRNGADQDIENIKHLLKDVAKFKTVKLYSDYRRIDILRVFDNIATSREMKGHDGFICFITSHGTSAGIRTVDTKGIVTVDELTTRLNGKQCKHLRGKPKLFFIQACRGRKADNGVSVEDPDVATDATADDQTVVPKLPTDADFLICYSTTKDRISLRRFSMDIKEKEMGSWFIHVLTNVFTEYMRKESVMQMMIRVNAQVANMATGDDHVDGKKEMPCQMVRLRARLMLGNHASK